MEANARILLIDDDRKLCRLVRDYLTPMGYSVETVHTGTEGVELAKRGGWDAVILDVMIPGVDGFEALRRIRHDSAMPVLMLTARGDESDRIVGLEMGADDYLPKTFSPRELLARLRAVLRRSRGMPSPGEKGGPKEMEKITVRDLTILPAARQVTVGGTEVALTPVEFDLLLVLARARGRVKSREQLVDEIRDREYDVFDRSVDVHISALRKKLGDDPKEPRYIRTMRAVGYMLMEAESR